MLRLFISLFVALVITSGNSNAQHAYHSIEQRFSSDRFLAHHAVVQSNTRTMSRPNVARRKTDTAASHVAKIPLTTSLINHNLATVDIDGQQIPMSCVNCTMEGLLHVKGTDVTWNSDALERDLGFDGGHIKAKLPHGLKGHFEFALSPPSSLDHTFFLPEIPIVAVAIPGLVDAGVLVSIGVPISIQMKKPAHMTFGFAFALPKDSRIRIDAADPHNSSVHGFKHKKKLIVKPLPIDISEPNLDAQVTTGLEFDIKLQAGILGDDIDAEIGARLHLPEITIAERQLSNVDAKCNSLYHDSIEVADNSTRAGTILHVRNALEQLVGKFTNIVPSVGVDFGVYVLAGVKDSFVGKDVKFLESKTARIFSTAFTLPTTCISNGKASSTATQSSSSNSNRHNTMIPTAEFIQVPSVTKQPSGALSSTDTISTSTSAQVVSSTTTAGSITSTANISTTSTSVVPTIPQNLAFSIGSSHPLALAIALGLLVASL